MELLLMKGKLRIFFSFFIPGKSANGINDRG